MFGPQCRQNPDDVGTAVLGQRAGDDLGGRERGEGVIMMTIMIVKTAYSLPPPHTHTRTHTHTHTHLQSSSQGSIGPLLHPRHSFSLLLQYIRHSHVHRPAPRHQARLEGEVTCYSKGVVEVTLDLEEEVRR